MVDYLHRKADTALLTGKYPYFTDRLVYQLRSTWAGAPRRMRHAATLDYALALILKGENREAIAVIDDYLKQTNSSDAVTTDNRDGYRILALAYMRIAETENCIAHHHHQACLIPLRGDGIHHDKTAARQSLAYLTRLLEFKPDDYQSIWLYNLAHMALGSHPDSVRPDWRISLAPDGEGAEFPRFPNRAMACGVATNNHAGGASLEDFNGDGYLDIFTTSYGLRDSVHLYLADGQGAFVDATEFAGIAGLTGGLNNLHADFNNDGW
ncbi:MAG: VCBS repeat-containing protein, partial [Bacteroidota bacterium]